MQGVGNWFLFMMVLITVNFQFWNFGVINGIMIEAMNTFAWEIYICICSFLLSAMFSWLFSHCKSVLLYTIKYYYNKHFKNLCLQISTSGHLKIDFNGLSFLQRVGHISLFLCMLSNLEKYPGCSEGHIVD